MPRHYPAELRRQTCERMLAGEAVKDLVAELGIAEVTLYKWRRQALIDAGRRPGAKSFEADPLLQARRRIKELEAELKAVKAASALFEEGAVDPKGSSRLSEGRTTWATPSALPVRSSALTARATTTSSSESPTTARFAACCSRMPSRTSTPALGAPTASWASGPPSRSSARR